MAIDTTLPGLFLLSFGAATLLPLGSEWLLAALVIKGEPLFACIATATLGNTLGALTSYLIGRSGSGWLMQHLLHTSAKQRQRAERWFSRYGSWALLFSWLPVVGDPLCLAAGVLRIPAWTFLVPVATGKLARYLAIAWLAVKSGL